MEKYIIALRKATKTTQKELAEKLGIDQTNYCRYEKYSMASEGKLEKIREVAISAMVPKLHKAIDKKQKELIHLKTLLKEATCTSK